MILKTRQTWLAAAGAAALAMTGCNSPPTVTEVRETTAGVTAQMLTEADATARETADGEAVAAIVGGANEAQGGSDSATLWSYPEEAATRAQFQRIKRFLEERVFTEENHESTEDYALIFRLMGDDICTDGSFVADPQCIRTVDAMELRLKAEKMHGTDGADLSITVLLGAKRAAPVTYLVGPQRLAVQYALGELRAAAQALGTEGAQFAAQLPQVLEGRLETSLERKGAKHFQLAFSVLEAARMEQTTDQGLFAFRTAAASPLSSLEVLAANKRVRVKADLGATRVSYPYGVYRPGGIAGTQLNLELGGLSYDIEAAEDQAELAIGKLGLGNSQTRVTLDEMTLFTADLNKDAGRTVDVTFERDGERLVSATVSPEFDLALHYALAPLGVDSGGEVPAHFDNEGYRFRLFGQGGAKVGFVYPNEETGAGGTLKLLAGNFLFSSSKGPSLTAATGACITSSNELPEGGHPVIDSLQTVACE